jgi:hypothetical protein
MPLSPRYSGGAKRSHKGSPIHHVRHGLLSGVKELFTGKHILKKYRKRSKGPFGGISGGGDAPAPAATPAPAEAAAPAPVEVPAVVPVVPAVEPTPVAAEITGGAAEAEAPEGGKKKRKYKKHHRRNSRSRSRSRSRARGGLVEDVPDHSIFGGMRRSPFNVYGSDFGYNPLIGGRRFMSDDSLMGGMRGSMYRYGRY